MDSELQFWSSRRKSAYPSTLPSYAINSTRPFRYDLNQIPYDYTVEVTNRFKGLDLMERVLEELWTEIHDSVQEAVIKTNPKKKKYKTGKKVV